MKLLPKPKLKLFKKKEDHFNVIDLGSSGVRVAIVRESDGLREREVRAEVVRPHVRGAMFGGQMLNLDAVTDTVGKALDEAVLKASVNPRRTVLGLSGGVMSIRSYKVRIRRKEPDSELDEKEFEVLADNIEEKTVAKALEDLHSLGNGKYVRVESVFTGYLVDGAKVGSPIGLPGAVLEVTVVHYFMEESKLRGFNNLVDELDLDVVSMVDTAVNAAIDWSEKYGDFTLFDVGGNVSQVVIMSGGKPAVSDSLFIGGDDITEAIKDRLGVSFEDAESLKVSYAQSQLSHERLQDIRSAIGDVVGIMVEGLAEVFRTSGLDDVPHTLVVSGESRHIPELKTALASFPWTKEKNISVFPKIELLSGKRPDLEALKRTEL